MELVSNKSDLLTNAEIIDNYLSEKSGTNYNYAISLIKNGFCFAAIRHNNAFRFYPSRFMGYKNNSHTLHIRNHLKDGRKTNPAISKILGQNIFIEELETEYLKYCKSLGVTPKKNKRSFWIFK